MTKQEKKWPNNGSQASSNFKHSKGVNDDKNDSDENYWNRTENNPQYNLNSNRSWTNSNWPNLYRNFETSGKHFKWSAFGVMSKVTAIFVSGFGKLDIDSELLFVRLVFEEKRNYMLYFERHMLFNRY